MAKKISEKSVSYTIVVRRDGFYASDCGHKHRSIDGALKCQEKHPYRACMYGGIVENNLTHEPVDMDEFFRENPYYYEIRRMLA